MAEPILDVRGLKVSIAGHPETQIVRGVDLTVRAGEIHALMGPNGSGKSTTASTIADKRARLGMFLSFQYPTAIPGVTMINLLRSALAARRGAEIPAREFLAEMREVLAQLKMDESFARRYVNDGFSGGEKKRGEIL